MSLRRIVLLAALAMLMISGWGCAALPQKASVTTTLFLPPTLTFQSVPRNEVPFVPTGDFCTDLRLASQQSSVSGDPTATLGAISTLITEAPPELSDVFELLGPLFARVTASPIGSDADAFQAVISASQDPQYQAAIMKLQTYARDKCGVEGVL
jgi:hypothetical protein